MNLKARLARQFPDVRHFYIHTIPFGQSWMYPENDVKTFKVDKKLLSKDQEALEYLVVIAPYPGQHKTHCIWGLLPGGFLRNYEYINRKKLPFKMPVSVMPKMEEVKLESKTGELDAHVQRWQIHENRNAALLRLKDVKFHRAMVREYERICEEFAEAKESKSEDAWKVERLKGHFPTMVARRIQIYAKFTNRAESSLHWMRKDFMGKKAFASLIKDGYVSYNKYTDSDSDRDE